MLTFDSVCSSSGDPLQLKFRSSYLIAYIELEVICQAASLGLDVRLGGVG